MTANQEEKLRSRIRELEEEVASLKSQLANEKVSNLEFDISHKETLQKCEDIEHQLFHATDQNQHYIKIQYQLQGHITDLEQQNRNFQQQIEYYQNREQEQQQQQQQQQNIINTNNTVDTVDNNAINNSNIHTINTNNMSDDDEYGKYDNVIKFDNDADNESSDTPIDEENKHLRHQLLDVQMEHENLQLKHRKSVSQIEEYQLQFANTVPPDEKNRLEDQVQRLTEKLLQTDNELKKEKKRNENLDKDRRNSLAQLSQNMFKKLLDSEHQHYDNTTGLEQECENLKQRILSLEESKHNLAMSTANTIDELRNIVRLMGRKLESYENNK